MIGTTVTVNADALEQLVRYAHTYDGSVLRCNCGQRLTGRDLQHDDPKTRHAEHVEYHVRQALAGRIEFP